MQRHVAVYCRRSRDPGQQGVSVAVQEKHGRRYAAQRWPELPLEVYVDNDLSAADPKVVRPAFQRMLDALRVGAVAHVVTREQSRLTRQPSEWEELCVTLSRAGIDDVHTTSSGVVSVAKASRLAGRLVAVVDAEEAERASVRIRVAAQAAAEEGKPAGSTCYGYLRALRNGRKTLLPHPEEARIVKRIVDEIVAGRSAGAIAKDLTAAGVATPRGAARWHAETVRTIARSPRIVAQRVHQGRIVGPGDWPAIVDRALWDRAQAQLASATVVSIDGRVRRAVRVQSTAQRYLLSGLAVCALCGTPLIASQQDRRHRGRIRAYACPSPTRPNGGCGKVSATAELVDAEVVARLRVVCDAGISVPVPDAGARRAAAERLAAAEARLTHLAHEYGRGEITEIEWHAARGAAANDADQARAELALAGRGPELDAAPAELMARWDTIGLRAQRDLLALVTERIAVGPRITGGPRWEPERVTVEWRG